ncbi:MAG TPA: hypothetical protein VGL46_13350 [Pseudonocardiaceae bacterium]|jgi:hypothetical protein
MTDPRPVTARRPMPLLCDLFIGDGDGERCRKPHGHAGRCDMLGGL